MRETSTIAFEVRLARLEKLNRSLLVAVIISSVAWIATGLGCARTTQPGSEPLTKDVLEAQRLVIKDRAGKTRVVIGAKEVSADSEPVYGITIYGKDDDSESTLSSSNLHIHYNQYSANFSPYSVEVSEHKTKFSELIKKASSISGIESGNTPSKQEQAEWEKIADDFEPIKKFYLNLVGPYLELKKLAIGIIQAQARFRWVYHPIHP